MRKQDPRQKEQLNSKKIGQPRLNYACQNFDTHELIKSLMETEGTDAVPFSGSSITTRSAQVVEQQQQVAQAPPSKNQQYDNGIYYTTIHFDSFYRDRSRNLSDGILSFSIADINNNKPLENVIQIRTERLYIPTPYTPAGSADLLYFRQAYIQITNLSNSQNVLASNNNSFTWEYDISTNNSVASLLTPINSIITFQTPITTLDTFTMQFKIPPLMKTLSLPNDIVRVRMVVPGTNPVQFDVVSAGDDTTDIYPVIGVIPTTNQVNVYMTDFTSSDPTLNVALTSTYGVKITTIISGSRFSIAGIDATAVVLQPADATMLIGPNRIAMTVRFTSVSNIRTNYLQANSL